MGGNLRNLGGTRPFHRAMDNGLTQAQAAEVVTHLVFFGGWPNPFLRYGREECLRENPH